MKLMKTIIHLRFCCAVGKTRGRLVYATCSILPDENQNIIAQFMALNPDFKIVSLIWVVMLKDLNLGKGDFL